MYGVNSCCPGGGDSLCSGRGDICGVEAGHGHGGVGVEVRDSISYSANYGGDGSL